MGLALLQRSGNVGCNPGFSPSLVDDLWSPECFLSAKCDTSICLAFPGCGISFQLESLPGHAKRKKKKTVDFCKKLLDIWRSGLHSKDTTSGHAWKTQQYKYSSQSIHLPILFGTQAPHFLLRVPVSQQNGDNDAFFVKHLEIH